MKNGKEIVLNYCKNIKIHDIEHLKNCLDNEYLIEQGKYDELAGCPSNYGLDDYVGLCEREDVGKDYHKQEEQCERCWKLALGIS